MPFGTGASIDFIFRGAEGANILANRSVGNAMLAPTMCVICSEMIRSEGAVSNVLGVCPIWSVIASISCTFFTFLTRAMSKRRGACLPVVWVFGCLEVAAAFPLNTSCFHC